MHEQKSPCNYEQCLICVHEDCWTGQIAREKGYQAYRKINKLLVKRNYIWRHFMKKEYEYKIDADIEALNRIIVFLVVFLIILIVTAVVIIVYNMGV